METGEAPQPTRPENQKPKVGDFGIENTTKAEKVRHIGERLWKRATAASSRLVAHYEEIRGKTTERVIALSRKAAVLGLTHVGVPIEDLLRQIFYEFPADVKDWQASRKDMKAYNLREEHMSVMDDYDEWIQGDKEDEEGIKLIQQTAKLDLSRLIIKEKIAKREARRLRKEAKMLRERGRGRFSNARRTLERLQTGETEK